MTIYGLMDLTLPAVPPRTRLYHLAPIGVGTATVESLTGYVMRLAEEHTVSTSALTTAALLPVMKPQGLAGVPAATWLLGDGPRFNGTGDTARDAVAALAGLTGRQDLAFLTLRSWTQVLAPHGLLRLKKYARAWCSVCYAEALEQGTPVYEPLLWSIAVVTICPRHHSRLSERCPHPDCARALPVIAAAARPGYCSHCKRFLYRKAGGHQAQSVSREEAGWDLWVADMIGELLAAAPALTPAASPMAFASALDAFISVVFDGRQGVYGPFAQAAGIHHNLVRRLRMGRALPTIDMLLRICHYFGVSLVEFLTGDTRGLGREGCAPAVIAPEKKPYRPSASLDTERLRRDVESVLSGDEYPPPSVVEVARRLGCTDTALYRLCPDDCRSISGRSRVYRIEQRDKRVQELYADVRQAMLQLDACDIYPASKRMWPLMQQRVHPRRSDYNSARRQILQELGWSTGGVRLTQAYLAQEDATGGLT